jgi:pyruvate,water dikinase
MIKHFKLVRYGIPVHNIGMNLLVQYLLTRFLGKEESSRLYPILISGLEHKLTETNEEILKLASNIHLNSELKTLIIKKNSKELYDLIERSSNPKILDFSKIFNEFLKNYGDRGFSREALYPRWNEAPEYLFDILKSLIKERKSDFKKVKVREIDYRQKIEQYVESKIRFQRFGLIKWKILAVILKNSRKYITFRENQRFNVDRWFTRNRNVYLEIAKILSDQGMLKEQSDVFFLHKKEVNKLVAGGLDIDIALLIERRKNEFFKYEYVIPPKFIFGNREFDDEFLYTEDSSLIRGLPASQGILTGKIHVLYKISEISTIKPGEILVVRQTDPGWTPAFKIIGGLITETGGVLSHGAVVAREYNIPAVTNVPNACKIFKTGQIVKIDGYSGTIIPKN